MFACSICISTKEVLFFFLACFEIMLSRTQPCLFALLDEEEKKGRSVTYFILLPDIQALFTTSLVQTAGHRMVARSLCRDIQTSIVNKQDKNIS